MREARTTERLPFSVDVIIGEYDPPPRLWHIPNVANGTCPSCGNVVDRSMGCITAAGYIWHNECFRCSFCRQKIDAQYEFVQKDDLIFHSECYQQCYNSRCACCTQLVAKKDGIQIKDKVYHRNCVKCERCEQPLIQNSKILTLYDIPYCQKCYEELIKQLPTCVTCQKPILPHERSIGFFFEGKKYFAHDPECSKCAQCGKNFKEKDLVIAQDRVCCRNCYREGLEKICAHCNEPIFDQATKLENVYWHANHFMCSICQQPLKPNTCVFNYGILKCRSCATEDRPICAGCQRPIQDAPIQACRGVWHKECLCCQICGQNVLKKKDGFFSVEDAPICKACFNEQVEKGYIDKKTKRFKNKKSKKGRR